MEYEREREREERDVGCIENELNIHRVVYIVEVTYNEDSDIINIFSRKKDWGMKERYILLVKILICYQIFFI